MLMQCEGCGKTISTMTAGILVVTERKVTRQAGDISVHDEIVKVWCPLCRRAPVTEAKGDTRD